MDKKRKAWDAGLRRKYGISADQYEELLAKQGGCCAICTRSWTTFKTRLSVDHNHHSREIRGLLCFYCNRFYVGRHRDPDLLRRIADYVGGGTGFLVPLKKRRKRRK